MLWLVLLDEPLKTSAIIVVEVYVDDWWLVYFTDAFFFFLTGVTKCGLLFLYTSFSILSEPPLSAIRDLVPPFLPDTSKVSFRLYSSECFKRYACWHFRTVARTPLDHVTVYLPLDRFLPPWCNTHTTHACPNVFIVFIDGCVLR